MTQVCKDLVCEYTVQVATWEKNSLTLTMSAYLQLISPVSSCSPFPSSHLTCGCKITTCDQKYEDIFLCFGLFCMILVFAVHF